jgi:hypothetical protein
VVVTAVVSLAEKGNIRLGKLASHAEPGPLCTAAAYDDVAYNAQPDIRWEALLIHGFQVNR